MSIAPRTTRTTIRSSWARSSGARWPMPRRLASWRHGCRMWKPVASIAKRYRGSIQRPDRRIPGGRRAGRNRSFATRQSTAPRMRLSVSTDRSRRSTNQRSSTPRSPACSGRASWRAFPGGKSRWSTSRSRWPVTNNCERDWDHLPDDSCERLQIYNVREPKPSDAAARPVVTFAAAMTGQAEFAALAGYLCGAGCALAVLPATPKDRRLYRCH